MMKSSAFPELDGLVDLACRDGIDIRPTLLRVLTDLYVQKPLHSAEEEDQYVELALGLIDLVDAPTRAAVIASLSNYPEAPAAILAKLNIAPAPSPAHSPANSAAHDTIEMFFAASSEERRLILSNPGVPKPAARRPASPSVEVIRRLETAALQHNVGEFSRILERALGVSYALAERMARDPSGEPIVIAAKTLGMSASVLQRILLFLNPAIGQSVDKVHSLSRLFEELRPDAAETMLSVWQTTGARARPAYEPVHADDERRSARSQATPTQHRVAPNRVAPSRNENPARFKAGERK